MMTVEERRDRTPILVKLGVGLVALLSIVDYLYFRITTKHINPSDSRPPPVSESNNEVDDGGRSMIEDDHQTEENGDLSLTYMKLQIDNLQQENKMLAKKVTELAQRFDSIVGFDSPPYVNNITDQDESCDPSSSNKPRSKKLKNICKLPNILRGRR